MEPMKTPGVYIVEKNAFPNSVVEVATAVPAFIGYTGLDEKNNKSVKNTPTRITSMAEYHAVFGFRSVAQFDLTVVADAPDAGAAADTSAVADTDAAAADTGADAGAGAKKTVDLKLADKGYALTPTKPEYRLYQSMQMFYLNGGGPCYIVSVGSYDDPIDHDALIAGIDTLVKEQEPTMLVIPDAMSLKDSLCYTVQGQMMKHCGYDMKNRFAILDIHNGFQDKVDAVKAFRDTVSNKTGGSFAAAYYPWVNTTLLSDSNVNFTNLSESTRATLQDIVNKQLDKPIEGAMKVIVDALVAPVIEEALPSEEPAGVDAPPTYVEIDKALRAASSHYLAILKSIKQKLNLMPPSSAMAGLFTMTDNARGVWKAPANLGVLGVSSPAFEISDEEQQNINVDTNGKSVNAIRSFIGEGTLVWGARTLDGNSLDWRYVNVRRTMIMLQQSVKLAAKAYVFEPNDAQTWVTVKSMISNFLTGIWKRGGLAGAVPSDAFSVHVGLGETMTGEDILEGILRITVLVAITRPAEFIEITFQQQMQKS